MKAYTQGVSKSEFVAQLKAHQAADKFISGKYWDGSSGCAVGCSLNSVALIRGVRIENKGDHSLYPEFLGVPEWLARLEDTIFEGVSSKRQKTWPVEFGEAINEGADLEAVKTPFLIFVLENCLASLDAVKFDADEFPDVAKAVAGSKDAVQQMIRFHREGSDLSAAQSSASAASAASAAWSAAESAASSASAARSAAWSAASAAWSAAESAASSASAARSAEQSAASAASAAWSAARSAAWSAASAAWSAARSAAWSAAESAASAASAAFEYYADELLRLMRECK